MSELSPDELEVKLALAFTDAVERVLAGTGSRPSGSPPDGSAVGRPAARMANAVNGFVRSMRKTWDQRRKKKIPTRPRTAAEAKDAEKARKVAKVVGEVVRDAMRAAEKGAKNTE